MAELKTQPTRQPVDDYLAGIADPVKRADSQTITAMMAEAAQAAPRMWGESIIGFGDAHLKYASGREIDWFLVGFAPRKQNLTLYLSMDVKQHGALLEKLGKHKTGAGCLYIKKLADVDQDVLKELIASAVAVTRALAEKS